MTLGLGTVESVDIVGGCRLGFWAMKPPKTHNKRTHREDQLPPISPPSKDSLMYSPGQECTGWTANVPIPAGTSLHSTSSDCVHGPRWFTGRVARTEAVWSRGLPSGERAAITEGI